MPVVPLLVAVPWACSSRTSSSFATPRALPPSTPTPSSPTPRFSDTLFDCTNSLRDAKPSGAQSRELHDLQFGSQYIASTSSSERSDDSYRNRYTMIAPVRLHPAKTKP